MLIVQSFHSIHDIDHEFVTSIEFLLQEEIASFKSLVELHDQAPEGCLFTYFLFFGPTQNAPVGFAQLCLKPVPFKQVLPWHKKLNFWNKSRKSWKQLSWQLGSGLGGLCVFDPKFLRMGKEKVQALMDEYEKRSDIVAQESFYLKGLQEFNSKWEEADQWSKEFYVLDPLTRATKSYQDYLESLSKDIQKLIRESWKNLYQKGKIELGDYSSFSEIAKKFPKDCDIPKHLLESESQILTFETEDKVLGCLMVQKGKNGNFFFEPYPFEPESEALVKDELYTQYALLKFFETDEARKCHLMKFGLKLTFDDKRDLSFFQSQGFSFKTVGRKFKTHLKELSHPL
jgi:hypothetical protein